MNIIKLALATGVLTLSLGIAPVLAADNSGGNGNGVATGAATAPDATADPGKGTPAPKGGPTGSAKDTKLKVCEDKANAAGMTGEARTTFKANCMGK